MLGGAGGGSPRSGTGAGPAGGAPRGALQLALLYLPGWGRVTPVVTENKELGPGGRPGSWARF